MLSSSILNIPNCPVCSRPMRPCAASEDVSIPASMQWFRCRNCGEHVLREAPHLNILFLSERNAARSIMAEAITNQLGKRRIVAFSAGRVPDSAVHPYTIDLLTKLGHDVSALHSKSWRQYGGADAPRMDFVIVLGPADDAAEYSRLFDNKRVVSWKCTDPVVAVGNEAERRLAFAETYRQLRNRIGILVNLPIRSLTMLALKHHLDSIGEREHSDDFPVAGVDRGSQTPHLLAG